MIRAAAYVRVSTQRQADEGLSLEAQENRVREHIKAENWMLTEVYVEKGVSGRRDDRPELGRLLDSLDSIDRLVIPKLDRLGRSQRHLLDLFDTLENASVELVSLADNIDTSTAGGKLMRSLRVALAEFESDTIGERVRAVTADRVASGKHHGRAPFGYESKHGLLQPVEPASSVVRRIFRDFTSGQSQRSIQRALNRESVPSQTGRDWTQATVSKLLANSTYVGRVVHKGEEFEGVHEALIDAETWEKVVRLREATARTKGKGRGRPSSGSHLFTRDLRLTCAECGEAMIPRTAGDRYLCHGRIKYGPDSCSMLPVPRAMLDAAVFEYFETVALDVEAMRDELREAAEDKAREVAELRRQAERDVSQAADAVARVRRDYTSGAITADEWRELSADLKAEHEAAKAKLAQLDARADAITATQGEVDSAESEAVRRLAEVRAAVAGEVKDAAGLNAVRAALTRMFESFQVARVVESAGSLPREARDLVAAQDAELDRVLAEDRAAVVEADCWTIMPVARPEVVAGVDETWRPILHREPLNIDAMSLAR